MVTLYRMSNCMVCFRCPVRMTTCMFFFRYPDGYFVQNVQFDFFNYAGIHRHVTLYTTPLVYIEDIIIATGIQGTDGMYSISRPRVPSCLKVMTEYLDFVCFDYLHPSEQ